MSKKVAVITGGNKGIGFAITKGLCQKFNGIVYLTARDAQRGIAAVKELDKLGAHPRFYKLDITDQQSIDKFKTFLEKSHGGIDILVNNAGISFRSDSSDSFETQAEDIIKANYFGLINVCKTLFPLLRPNARVVNLSSVFGHLSKIPSEELRTKLGKPDLTEDELSALMLQFIKSVKKGTNVEDGWGSGAYNVSKNGVSALTMIQQRDFDKDSRQGICVNCCHPGFVQTDLTAQNGQLTIDEGAEAPLFLALLPSDETKYKGCYVWRDKTIADWRSAAPPAKY